MENKFEALLVEETCGKTVCGQYYLITINDKPFAKVIREVNEETTKTVQEVLNALNKSYENC